MKKLNFNLSAEWFRLMMIFVVTIIVGALVFLINNMLGIFNIMLFIIQAIIGIIFAAWYTRIFLIYIREIRRKEPEKKVGMPKGWAIYGLITCLINIGIWGFMSPLIFNFPKIYFLIPSLLAMIQIFYVFISGNRKRIRDWFLVTYNVLVFLYLFNWTLVDFGVDLPNFLGVFAHTLNSGVMWWQLVFVNTGAFFAPTFLFPPYMFNPRYYFAMPIANYLAQKETQEKEISEMISSDEKETALNKEEGETEDSNQNEKDLPGERTPFFEERRKQDKLDEEIKTLRREMSKSKEDSDVKYAQFVGSSDMPFGFRNFINRFDSFLRLISLSVILVLLVVTPVVFAGNVFMNVIPNYLKQDYGLKPGMDLTIKGNVFSSFYISGNVSETWSDDLDNEIAWAKELHATHIRYDVGAIALANNNTQDILNQGFQRIRDEGLKIVISVAGDFVFSKRDLLNIIYNNSLFISQTYQPDYMVIFNEINGDLQSYQTQDVTIQEWMTHIENVSSLIKSNSPTTKILITFLAIKSGSNDFQAILENSTLSIDAIGVTYYPVLFGWRMNTLLAYNDIFQNSNSSLKFWISEVGMESFNFGEDAQAKFLGKILSLASLSTEINADGVCIESMSDNIGITVDRGITNHFGLIYYNGRKKRAFDAVAYAFGKISGVI
ncbi:MAG: glycosyl hydrolase 53 family protein [Candidatus Heimdallarchaeota archaeon]|nr:glycosyl hydrolase 53 family protein [Candidatus Heimdallarchaeota archaeon]MBY8994344.1 glycosyl hydrolase 53 family protein [Candidatus Heimdallarchaeota archaeon]